jgi:DNA-binding transcriptional LysR family regulator
MIELRKLRHVVEIARHGSFLKAAAALHITQSALTKSVQTVEDQLGLLLFERGPKGVQLTPEGERFVMVGNRLLADAEELEREAKSVRQLESGRVRVGAAPAGLDHLWVEALPVFAKDYPGVRIETLADNSVERIVRLLLRGDLDFAIGAFGGVRKWREIDVEFLFEMPIQPFVRRGHPLDKPEAPTKEALLSYPWVGVNVPEPHDTILSQLAREAGAKWEQPHIIVTSFHATTRVVESTNCVSAVFSRYALNPNFSRRFRSWPGHTVLPPLEIDLISRIGWRATHAARQFIEYLHASHSQTLAAAKRIEA